MRRLGYSKSLRHWLLRRWHIILLACHAGAALDTLLAIAMVEVEPADTRGECQIQWQIYWARDRARDTLRIPRDWC